MSDFERLELLLRRAYQHELNQRIQDPSTLYTLKLLMDLIEKMIRDHDGLP